MFMKELAEDIDLAKTGVEWGECQVKGAASTKGTEAGSMPYLFEEQ